MNNLAAGLLALGVLVLAAGVALVNLPAGLIALGVEMIAVAYVVAYLSARGR